MKVQFHRLGINLAIPQKTCFFSKIFTSVEHDLRKFLFMFICSSYAGSQLKSNGELVETRFLLSDTFWTNPQYRVSVTDPDDDDDDNLCTVVLGLMQKDRRKKREQGLDMLTIGYCIYKVLYYWVKCYWLMKLVELYL